ncbi:MAG TPA: TetR/AcrR family transcriptional regulator [Longimicrobium sp.]|nr:TetR/AcrR family transcriptional regulator [Longimicrobium sp.]
MERSRLENTRPPGRPRSAAAHGAILDAAIALIREAGYDALTMEAIAARAGVGKATVYRRWPGKETLVAEAIGRIVRAVPTPDTGSAAEDLRTLMRATLRMYQDPATAPLLSGLVAAMARSAPIAAAVRAEFVGPRREGMRAVLARGAARGELRADTDLELALDLLSGAPFYRYLVHGGAVDEALVEGAVDAVLRAFAPEVGPITRKGGG